MIPVPLDEQQCRPSKHVCLTLMGLMDISDDPEYDMICALADKDVLTLVRGLSKQEARSPFTDGLFGMEEKRVNAAIRKLTDAGLISSRRDGNDHVYFLNDSRFRELAHFIEELIKE